MPFFTSWRELKGSAGWSVRLQEWAASPLPHAPHLVLDQEKEPEASSPEGGWGR